MKTKISKLTSTGKELWLEVTNVNEVVSNEFPVAICEWKVVDETNSIIIPPPGEGSLQYVHGSLTPALYSQWDKTEEHYCSLLAQSLSALLTSNLIG